MNTASAYGATVGGGVGNRAIATLSTIGGGVGNDAIGARSTIAGGVGNEASGDYSTVVGGDRGTASGYYSTVAGGSRNTASGNFSFAAGRLATASHANSFVWGDFNGGGSSGNNTFNVHASGGIYLNGAVAHASGRDAKEAFVSISARDVLDKVVEMPLTTWRFKAEDDSIRHIGPMAQDFMAAFGYGRSDKHIVGTDADGVALAAIQGLNERLEEQLEVNTVLRWHNVQMRSRNDALAARLERLENAILRHDQSASSTD